MAAAGGVGGEMTAAAGGDPTAVAGGVSGETRAAAGGESGEAPAAAGYQSGETTAAAAGDSDEKTAAAGCGTIAAPGGETTAAAEGVSGEPGAAPGDVPGMTTAVVNALQILWSRQKFLKEEHSEYERCRSSDCDQMKWMEMQMNKQEERHRQEVQKLHEQLKQHRTELLDAQRQLWMQQDVQQHQKIYMEWLYKDQIVQLWQELCKKNEVVEQVQAEQMAMSQLMEKVLEQLQQRDRLSS
jgi:hypothetical protein